MLTLREVANGGNELVFTIHCPFAESTDMIAKRSRRNDVNEILAEETQSVWRVAAADVLKYLRPCQIRLRMS